MTNELESNKTFASLGLSENVLKALDENGWTIPTPVQAHSVPVVKTGVDAIVQARTGTGKTGAFGLPLLDGLLTEDGGFQALILAPTRELALQSAREIGKLAKHTGLKTAAVYGGASIEKQIKELEDGAQIVSGTPGRVLDHLRRGTLKGSQLKVLTLDEADEMLSMGFAKEINAILEMLPKERQTLLFSATVDGPVERMAERHLNDPVRIDLAGDAVGALTIEHHMFMVSGIAREDDLIKVIEIEDPDSAIIFCNTKAETERVDGFLKRAGFNSAWLNGDLAQNERERIMGATREGKIRFLVATDVAARGIDVSHLTHVINFALPDHLEQYIHRTGRTGRAGRTGTAISLVAPKELGALYYLRLQYKIRPVERSLPNSAEARARAELDRLQLLESGVPRGSEASLGLARRLMTHPDAEKIIGGLVSAFFGEEDDVEEKAAAARRSRRGPVVEAPQKKERKERRDRKERRKRRERPSQEAAAPETSEEVAEPTPETEPASAAPEASEDRAEEAKLFLSIGKKHDIRVGDVNRLFQEHAELDREDVGRIRLRDKHSFVYVPEGVADAVIEKLHGFEFEGVELTVERARR